MTQKAENIKHLLFVWFHKIIAELQSQVDYRHEG